jgi:hypothetical protein
MLKMLREYPMRANAQDGEVNYERANSSAVFVAKSDAFLCPAIFASPGDRQ